MRYSFSESCVFVILVAMVIYWVTLSIKDSMTHQTMHSGYVCQKLHVPGHYLGKAWQPDSYSATISESDTCADRWKSSEFTLTLENYEAIRVGDRVIKEKQWQRTGSSTTLWSMVSGSIAGN